MDFCFTKQYGKSLIQILTMGTDFTECTMILNGKSNIYIILSVVRGIWFDCEVLLVAVIT